jgi:hypothetical protein
MFFIALNIFSYKLSFYALYFDNNIFNFYVSNYLKIINNKKWVQDALVICIHHNKFERLEFLLKMCNDIILNLPIYFLIKFTLKRYLKITSEDCICCWNTLKLFLTINPEISEITKTFLKDNCLNLIIHLNNQNKSLKNLNEYLFWLKFYDCLFGIDDDLKIFTKNMLNINFIGCENLYENFLYKRYNFNF